MASVSAVQAHLDALHGCVRRPAVVGRAVTSRDILVGREPGKTLRKQALARMAAHPAMKKF